MDKILIRISALKELGIYKIVKLTSVSRNSLII